MWREQVNVNKFNQSCNSIKTNGALTFHVPRLGANTLFSGSKSMLRFALTTPRSPVPNEMHLEAAQTQTALKVCRLFRRYAGSGWAAAFVSRLSNNLRTMWSLKG